MNIVCRTCQVEKDESKFQKDRRKHTGRAGTCNQCNHKKYKQYRRDWEVRKEFGISLDEYNKRKDAAGNQCEVCGSDKHIHLDHNHTTGKIRGFLCVNCNMGIGQFKDDPELIKKAIRYLQCQENTQ